MSTLTPTGSGRRSPVPVVLAVVVALALGIAGGWWFAGRDANGSGASPTAASTCSRTPSGSGSASKSVKPVVLPNPRQITVNVYNATSRKGLARSTSVELASRGFVVGKVANDPLKRNVAATAEVRYGRKGAQHAKVVAAQVPAPVLVLDGRADTSVDFVIGNGYTALSTTAQAQAALTARPSASSSTGC